MIKVKFYQTFYSQYEFLPRITIVYDNESNGVAFEWLWFGVFIYNDVENVNK